MALNTCLLLFLGKGPRLLAENVASKRQKAPSGSGGLTVQKLTHLASDVQKLDWRKTCFGGPSLATVGNSSGSLSRTPRGTTLPSEMSKFVPQV